jgi:hypothetical protein
LIWLVIVLGIVAGAVFVELTEKLEKAMSVNSDRIIAAFDDFKKDVSDRLAALAAKVSAAASLSDAESAPILADISAAKAAVDAAPAPPVVP